MKVYSISYDLNKLGKDYKGLHEEIKRSPVWWHYLNSTWLVVTSEQANQIFQRLQSHIDNNDYVPITQLSNDYSGWLPQDARDWIKKYLN